ncbi:MAG: NAD(P)H-dependent glycerol-3-phosphate dehydrogenase [Anaeroplasmataceae bacterium]
MKVSIIGGGSWGTTLAQCLSDNKHSVLIQDINAKFVDTINQEHIHPFFNVDIPHDIKATVSLEEVCNYSDIIILCVPTKVIRQVLENIKKIVKTKKTFVNVSKGIEPETSMVSSKIVEQVCNDIVQDYVVLSGPSHAEELICRKFTTLVSTSYNSEASVLIQKLFNNENYLRVYTSDDVIGAEVCGSIKNAIAIVSGVAAGLGLGENARAALITRGIREVIIIVELLGGKRSTVYGLTGVGDLIVTASSPNSRNFNAGYRIGQGEDLDHVLNSSLMIIEGFRSIYAAYEIGRKNNVELPIINIAHKVLSEKLDLKSVLPILLNRELKRE